MTLAGNEKKVPAPQLLEMAKALSSDLRLRILEVLGDKPMSVTELAKLLGFAQPTVSINVAILEEAGLIETAQRFGRGKQCSRTCDSIVLELPRSYGDISEEWKTVEMPVGMYNEFRVKSPCGLIGQNGLIGQVDEPRSFYLPERSGAMLIWFSEDGYVEYRFPNVLPSEADYKAIAVSAELCSEFIGYKEDWPSDITLSINGREIGTYTSTGDFGENKGAYTPSWWYGGTQHGQLTEWRVGADGSLLNGQPCSAMKINDLGLEREETIVVRFEVKAGARNRGGLNLFGACFGNEQQAIRLTFIR
ncbi:ArsR/SmtB family transcription factor [Paenibacillus thalictri]|nr:helix-turn-helix domain-containing protein [Paenibacillus thalictri]